MRFTLPQPLVLLLGGVATAAALTWILPAGQYERRLDPDTGRQVAVAGTYQRVEGSPVNPMQAVLAVPRGIVSGADVILTVLFVGGTFALLDATGALARLVGSLVRRARRPGATVVAVSLAFATLGALENMHEDMLTPTNGALLAMLFSAQLSFGRWLRFAVPGSLLVALVGLAGVVMAG
jgi:uncharacterized ion transporter superfamily protein YfcC